MNIFWELVPMMLGTALAPLWIIVVLLILRSPNGLVKATAFVIGTTLVRLLQGLAFGYLFGAVEPAAGRSSIVSVLLMVLGLLLLISAIKSLLHEEDPDAPPPKWMSTFDRATAPRLLGLGALLTVMAPKLWVFTLSALGVIRGAALSSTEAVKVFLLYLLGAQALLIAPLLLYAMMPGRSARWLQSASDWLTRYNRPITFAVSLIFGSLFLWKGVSGLLL